MKETIKLAHTKTTKGTYVYTALTNDALIKFVYVQRAISPVPPETIKLTLEV